MAKLGLMRGLSALALGLSLGCTQTPAEEAPAAAPPSTFGDALRVTVAGRGIVASDPGGIYCGNDADQQRCVQDFLFDPAASRKKIVLLAKEMPNWHFKEWEFTVDENIPYDPANAGLDRGNPKLVLEAGTVRGADGKERPLRHRVTAKFEPTSVLEK
jgi:hypothetical protein